MRPGTRHNGIQQKQEKPTAEAVGFPKGYEKEESYPIDLQENIGVTNHRESLPALMPFTTVFLKSHDNRIKIM